MCRYAGHDPNSPDSGPATDWTQPPPISQGQAEGGSPRSVRSTSRRRGNSRSQPSSLSGSPPVNANHPPLPNGKPVSLASGSRQQGVRQVSSRSAHSTVPLSPYQPSYNRQQRPSGTRKESMGGGMQVILGETGSWSELAKNDTTLPADAKLEGAAKPTGMLSFLKSKKGRGHSPKPQVRGVLGKENARVVISSGE